MIGFTGPEATESYRSVYFSGSGDHRVHEEVNKPVTTITGRRKYRNALHPTDCIHIRNTLNPDADTRAKMLMNSKSTSTTFTALKCYNVKTFMTT